MTARPQPPREPTLAPLEAILAIVGTEAPALLQQLDADLALCNRTIRQALPALDWQALRQASHNLTALAGTSGADTLQSLAEALNRAAHGQDPMALPPLGDRIQAELATLSATIRALSARRGQR